MQVKAQNILYEKQQTAGRWDDIVRRHICKIFNEMEQHFPSILHSFL